MERSSPDAITVWRVSLDVTDAAAEALRSHLRGEELERLRRLERSAVGRRWLVSRGALREILAAELGTEPGWVGIQLDPGGRPMLDPSAHRTELDFNLSHSGELALVAVARGRRVGVDVERDRGRDPLRVADRYFSATEAEAIRSVPDAERPLAFLRYWTAKEALAKAIGRGLSVDSGELEMAPGADGGLVPLRADGDWSLVELVDLPAGYRGALAAAGPPPETSLRDWQPGGG